MLGKLHFVSEQMPGAEICRSEAQVKEDGPTCPRPLDEPLRRFVRGERTDIGSSSSPKARRAGIVRIHRRRLRIHNTPPCDKSFRVLNVSGERYETTSAPSENDRLEIDRVERAHDHGIARGLGGERLGDSRPERRRHGEWSCYQCEYGDHKAGGD